MSEHSQSAFISVVIPTYNAARFVTDALDSVLSQTVRPGEILVIDDGSTDDTEQSLRPYRDRIRYIAQRNQGVSAARNRGVLEARGGLVAFLDADDVWHPRKLELQLAALADNHDCGLIGTAMFAWPSASIPALTDQRLHKIKKLKWEQLVVRNHIIASSVLVRRDALRSAGLFDARIKGAEDRDLWIRIAEITRVANLALPLTGYRSVPGSLSKSSELMRKNWDIILRKLDERYKFTSNWLLRRKACGYFCLACSYVDSENGYYGKALQMLSRSFAVYPFPFARDEVEAVCARPRSFVVNLLRLMQIKRS